MNVTRDDLTEEKIISLLEKKLMSTSELAKLLDMRRDMIVGYLEALKGQGKVEMIIIGRSHVYKPKEHSAKRED